MGGYQTYPAPNPINEEYATKPYPYPIEKVAQYHTPSANRSPSQHRSRPTGNSDLSSR